MDVFARKKMLDEGSGGVLSLKRGNLLQHLGLSAAIVLVASLHLGLRLPFGHHLQTNHLQSTQMKMRKRRNDGNA